MFIRQHSIDIALPHYQLASLSWLQAATHEIQTNLTGGEQVQLNILHTVNHIICMQNLGNPKRKTH